MTQAVRLQQRHAIALILKRARGYGLLSQPELAKKLGVSARSVAAYEAAETEAPATVVLEWLRVCGRPIDDLGEACAPWDSNPEPADFALVDAA